MEDYIEEPKGENLFITFGDLTDALYKHHRFIPERGTIEFTFVPNRHMVWKKRIPRSDYTTEGFIIKEYPEEYCIIEFTSRKFLRILILTDYYLNTTQTLEKHYKNLTLIIQNLRKQNETLFHTLKRSERDSEMREAHRAESEKRQMQRLKNLREADRITLEEQNGVKPGRT